jgi:hypothetical protein
VCRIQQRILFSALTAGEMEARALPPYAFPHPLLRRQGRKWKCRVSGFKERERGWTECYQTLQKTQFRQACKTKIDGAGTNEDLEFMTRGIPLMKGLRRAIEFCKCLVGSLQHFPLRRRL